MAKRKKKPIMLVSRTTICLFLLILVSACAFSPGIIPDRQRFKTIDHKIADIFFDRQGNIDHENVAVYLREIETRRSEAVSILTGYYEKRGRKTSKARKKALKDGFVFLYDLLITYIQKLDTLQDKEELRKLAEKIIEIDYALKSQGKLLASLQVANLFKLATEQWVVPRNNSIKKEARNLFCPSTGRAYTHEELRQLKADGKDISLLDPPPFSTFWHRRENISDVDIVETFYNGGDPLYEGIRIEFPKDKAFFRSVRKAQTTPKLNLFIRDGNGKKVRLKIKIGQEMYSDPTVSSLAMALGFSTDITKYVRDFKVILGKTSLDEFKKEWMSYYHGGVFRDYDVNEYIKETGQDEDGNYVTFVEGVLEAKPKELIRVGPWAFSSNGHQNLREVRAMMLFNMWVGNSDPMEAGNNKLVLRKFEDDYRLFHIQHDMSYSLGKTFVPEIPGKFPWHLICGIETQDFKRNEEIAFDYMNLNINGIYGKLTFADCKWMARLIAQLTRKQIEDAVKLGGWPDSVGKLLVEKLISRRNDLVYAFNLGGEVTPAGTKITLMPVDRSLSTPDEVVVDGKLSQSYVSGYTKNFGDYFSAVMGPIAKDWGMMLIELSQTGIGALDEIAIDPDEFGLDKRIVSRVLVRFARRVIRNPTSESDGDMFLVEDIFEIGLRLGYGLVLSGDASYKKKFTLVYPMRTRVKADFARETIIDVSLPYRVLKQKLPETYVLTREDILETSGRVEFRGSGMTLGTEGILSHATLNRTVVTNRYKNSLLMYEDRSVYNEVVLQAFAQIPFLDLPYLHPAYLKVPFIRLGHQFDGKLNGVLYVVPNDITEGDSRVSEEISKVIQNGDFSKITDFSKRVIINDKFSSTSFMLNLIGFYKFESLSRDDEITTKDYDVPDGEVRERSFSQHRSSQNSSWDFVDNGEEHRANIRIFGGESEKYEDRNPRVVCMSYEINDKNTKNKEMERGYLGFVNGVSGMKDKLIEFTPSLHTANQLWGNLDINVDIQYYQEAIDQLLQIDKNEYWRELDKTLEAFPLPWWKRKSVVEHSESFLTRTRKAARSSCLTKRLKWFAGALKRAVYKSGMTFEYRIIHTLNRILRKKLGEDAFFVNCLVTPAERADNNLVDQKYLYGETGDLKDREDAYVILSPYNIVEQYGMFDWVF